MLGGIVQVFDQALQSRHLTGNSRSVFCIIGEERGELAAKQTIQQALALALDAICATYQGAIPGSAQAANSTANPHLRRTIDQVTYGRSGYEPVPAGQGQDLI